MGMGMGGRAYHKHHKHIFVRQTTIIIFILSRKNANIEDKLLERDTLFNYGADIDTNQKRRREEEEK